MEITEIKVFPVQEDKLKGYVTITLDHCFVVRDIKIIEGPSGFFVSMPSKKQRRRPSYQQGNAWDDGGENLRRVSKGSAVGAKRSGEAESPRVLKIRHATPTTKGGRTTRSEQYSKPNPIRTIVVC